MFGGSWKEQRAGRQRMKMCSKPSPHGEVLAAPEWCDVVRGGMEGETVELFP